MRRPRILETAVKEQDDGARQAARRARKAEHEPERAGRGEAEAAQRQRRLAEPDDRPQHEPRPEAGEDDGGDERLDSAIGGLGRPPARGAAVFLRRFAHPRP